MLPEFPIIDLAKRVEDHNTATHWSCVLKKCERNQYSEEMCAHCKMEQAITRLAIIEEKNLSPQDALGRHSDDSVTLMLWKLMAERGGCKKCHEREYVACLCLFDELSVTRETKMTKVHSLLLQWRQSNAALSVDSYLHGANYLDFVLRRVKYETCAPCSRNYQNIVLPPKKRLCVCVHVSH